MQKRKTAVITGASQGIGAGLTNSFLERGYNVVATSRQVSRSAELNASDRLARVDGDIADPETAKAVVETALARFGSIDALVNNAGIFFTKPFIDYTIEDYRRLAATNLEGFLHLTQRVVRQMLAQKRGGSIVSITTPMVDRPIAGVNASVAMLTKGGIEAMSKNIAMEYARQHIRANTVAPGVVDTPLHKDNPKDFLNTLSPMHSISSVQEIVDAVLFLTEAPRITGEVLNVDGGAHLGKMVTAMSTQASAERRLSDLGIALPPPPTPYGAYVETVKIGNLLYLSGMLPVVGRELKYVGRVGGAVSAEDGRKAAEIACLNALSAARAHLGSLDKITGVAKLGVYIATEGDFRDHPKVADGASELLVKVFGTGMLSGRIVLGVASLPLGLPIEVELVFEVAS